MNSKTYLCDSSNGKHVTYDEVDSHAATHFNDKPELKKLVTAILSGKSLSEPIVTMDVDMGETIGTTDVVEVDESDEIVYAIRIKREDQGYVPFTKSRVVQESSHVSLYLIEKDSTTYELSSAWIGEFESPPFPQMPNPTAESIPYWTKHAFVWGSQKIEPGTAINICPW
jgi:hypothetical protein